MSTLIKEKLLERFDALPDDLQRRVWDFVQALAISVPKGVPGTQLLKFAGDIPTGDLHLMREAIETGCERVDDEW
jgi:hypothetical protein